jgi:prephenate dehydrogenase
VRIAVVGTGLVGGSIGLALRGLGHDVVGFDGDSNRAARAKELGAIDSVAASLEAAARNADLVFVAVPVSAIAGVATAALDAGARLVTDVGSVKGPVVAEVVHARPDAAARFLGGHPMAGSEQDGVDGARADLFVGATWVLTPTAATDQAAFAELRALLRAMHAEVVSVTPADHDELVALVSHVPQIASSTLMDVAVTREAEHQALLRLAAGGFRDMTRIAASHPGIWLDILTSNRDAVLAALDAYLDALHGARELVAAGDRDALEKLLARARKGRRNLPVGAPVVGELVELHVPVLDRPGVLAEVTTLAGRLGVNIEDFSIAHSAEGPAGVLKMVVARSQADAFEQGLHELGYLASRAELS